MQDMIQEDYVAPFFAVLSGSFFIFGIAVTYLFWHRRDKFPIKGRLPRLGVCSSLSIIFWVCSVTLQRVWMIDTPCLVIIWILHAAFLPIFSFFFLRVWLLHFAYNATDQMLQTVKSGRSKDTSKEKKKDPVEKKTDPTTEALKQLEPPNSNPNLRNRSGSNSSGSGNGSAGTVSLKQWYLINKHLTTDAMITKIFLVMLAIELAPAVVISIASPSTYDRVIEHPCGTPYLASALVVCIIAIAFVLFFLYISYKLSRFSDDGFSIKKELRFMGLFCPPAIVVWLLLTYIGPIQKVNDKIIGINAIWCWICGIIVLTFVNIYPIYLSYKMEQITTAFNLQSKAIVENSPEAQVSDLAKILKHPDGFESFQRYAMGEFSVENVLFWREAQYFKHAYADSSLSESYDQDDVSESEDHPVQDVVSNTVLSESDDHSPTSPVGIVRTKSGTISDKTPRAPSFRTSQSGGPTSPPSTNRSVPRIASNPGAARRSSESSSQSGGVIDSLANAVPNLPVDPTADIHAVANPVFGKTMVHKPTKSQRRKMASKEGTLKRLKKHHSAQIRGVGSSPLLHPDGVDQLSITEAAKLIYDRFIADNSPLQVNLPSQVRNNLTIRLEALLQRENQNAAPESIESPRLELRIPIPKDPVSPRESADQVAMLPLRTSSNPNIIPEDRSASDTRSSLSVSANSATNPETTPAPFPNVLNVGPGFIGNGNASPDGSSSRLLPPSPTNTQLPRASPPTSPRKVRTLTEELEPLESDAHLFEEAQQSIFHLMQADIYGRYRTSDEFRELITLLTDRKHEHELLREMEK